MDEVDAGMARRQMSVETEGSRDEVDMAASNSPVGKTKPDDGKRNGRNENYTVKKGCPPKSEECHTVLETKGSKN